MEVQKLLKILSEGLKILARGVEVIAERIIDSARDKSAAAPQSKKPSVSLKSFQGESKSATEAKEPAPGAAEPVEKKAAEPVGKKAVVPAKKKVSGPAEKKTAKRVTAMGTVLNIIGSSETGVNTAAIREKSGYEQKKVSNIVYKLKKQGKITVVKKGVYVKS
ncbi:MAG: hypothetical protein GY850_13825 [bacterium]|nr:hypothetical protein [bacterium]